MIRKTVFWTHLTCGLVAAIVVLNLALTGVILTYERQIETWLTEPIVELRSPDQQRLPIAEILARTPPSTATSPANNAQPNRAPRARTVVIYHDEMRPVMVRSGRRGGIPVDPYTGETMEPRNAWINEFFSVTLRLHRWFNFSGDSRPYAKFIVGVGNLIFLFLVLSGLYLWFPRRWIPPVIKSRFVPRMRHQMAKARDYNWHHAMGFWTAIPLIALIVTGSVFSFRWTGDVIYAAFGAERPGPPGGEQVVSEGRPQSAAENGQQRAAGHGHAHGNSSSNAATAIGSQDVIATPRGRQQARGGRGNRVGRDGSRARGPASPSYETLQATVTSAYPDWQSVAITVPNSPTPTISIQVDSGDGGQPQKRTTVEINRRSGAIVETETFADLSLGLRIRAIVRFLHTGAYFGFWGQTIAGIASLVSLVMVWTGVAMAYRRLILPAVKRRRVQQSSATRKPASV